MVYHFNIKIQSSIKPYPDQAVTAQEAFMGPLTKIGNFN